MLGLQAPTEVQKIDPVIAKVLISERAFDGAFPRPSNIYTFVNTDGGETAANTAALEKALKPFPDAVPYTKAGWVEKRASGIDTLLNLLYVLLALSVIVSLFGMVNTLVLSVFERTREIGMLRAVGMTRRQVRRMIRQESVITALIGAGLGLPLGIFLAAVFTQILADQGIGFSLPIGSLIAFHDRRDPGRGPGGGASRPPRRAPRRARGAALRVRPAREAGRQHPNVTLGVLALGGIAYALLQSLVAPALPDIQHSLHTSETAVGWILTAYLLSASVATPIVGRLGDMHGKERVLLIVLVLLAAGTLISAVASSIGVMIAGRVIQGAGGGIFPLAFAIIRDEFPPRRSPGGSG